MIDGCLDCFLFYIQTF